MRGQMWAIVILAGLEIVRREWGMMNLGMIILFGILLFIVGSALASTLPPQAGDD